MPCDASMQVAARGWLTVQKAVKDGHVPAVSLMLLRRRLMMSTHQTNGERGVSGQVPQRTQLRPQHAHICDDGQWIFPGTRRCNRLCSGPHVFLPPQVLLNLRWYACLCFSGPNVATRTAACHLILTVPCSRHCIPINCLLLRTASAAMCGNHRREVAPRSVTVRQ